MLPAHTMKTIMALVCMVILSVTYINPKLLNPYKLRSPDSQIISKLFAILLSLAHEVDLMLKLQIGNPLWSIIVKILPLNHGNEVVFFLPSYLLCENIMRQ